MADIHFYSLYHRFCVMGHAWSVVILSYLCDWNSSLLAFSCVTVSLLFLGCAAYAMFKFPGFLKYAWETAASRGWKAWQWAVNIAFLFLLFAIWHMPEDILHPLSIILFLTGYAVLFIGLLRDGE